MKTFIVFAAVIFTVSALSLHEQWADFKAKHSKVYKNIAEETARFDIFQQNLKTINEHNAKYEAGLSTYWMGVNKFTDMSEEEFQAMMNRQIASKPKIQGELHVQENVSLPQEVDWRKKGVVLKVKNQGKCGSWAFSATGALEGQNAIKNDYLVSLSEQQLLDCSQSYGNNGCNAGGFIQFAFDYVRDNGILSEEIYPNQEDQEEQSECRVETSLPFSVLKIQGYKEVPSTTDDLLQAVATVGPISAAIHVNSAIRLYEGGIFIGDCDGEVNQGVLVVGYGQNLGTPYWIVKNSWGSDWGENGYIRIARWDNLCGIANSALYPLVYYN